MLCARHKERAQADVNSACGIVLDGAAVLARFHAALGASLVFPQRGALAFLGNPMRARAGRPTRKSPRSDPPFSTAQGENGGYGLSEASYHQQWQ